jgi:hypothetical protein
VFLAALAVAASACGVGDPGALQPVGAPVVADAAPPSTVPAPIEPLTCEEPIATIVERELVARRQHSPSPGCLDDRIRFRQPVAAPSDDATSGAGDPCWDRCADGSVFVDFALSPVGTDGDDRGDGASSVDVRYVATYRDPAGRLTDRAEILTLSRTPDAPQRWSVAAVATVDLLAEIRDVTEIVDGYLDALASGDVLTAAELLAVVEGDDVDRPDLARLADERLLADRSAAAIAAALTVWCAGAECARPDAVRVEITSDHSTRAVATYRSDSASVDVVLDAGRVGGRPFVVGIPPVLP